MRKGTSVLPELDWKKKFKASCTSDANVSINVCDGGKRMTAGTKMLSIVIRDNLYKQFNSEFITFAILKNRIYFKGVDKHDGYKVSLNHVNGYVQATLQPKEVKAYSKFIGDYSLKYDEIYELYYIEKITD